MVRARLAKQIVTVSNLEDVSSRRQRLYYIQSL